MEKFALQLCTQYLSLFCYCSKGDRHLNQLVQCCPHLSHLFKLHGFLSYLMSTLGWEDPLEEGMATLSSILAWRIPMDRGACWATVHGVTNGRTQLSD